MSTQIQRRQLGLLIQSYNGDHFFSVKFIKRTTGETRDMVCRKGVSKYTKGGELKYDPIEKGLVGVWEANNPTPDKAYRMIPLEGLIEAKIDGNHYVAI